jgi:hypothetical protein
MMETKVYRKGLQFRAPPVWKARGEKKSSVKHFYS